MKLQCFTDVDREGSPSNRKIIPGAIFSVGFATISWYRRKQRFVVLSSTKVEYMVACQATYEAI